jgi:hypothetical protein
LNRKVKEIAEKITGVISDWKGVEAIAIGRQSVGDVFDPNFLMEFDVYFQGDIPPASERKKLLGDPIMFFTNPVPPLDRFLIGELPLLIHYQNRKSIELLPQRFEKNEWVHRNPPMNILYRIQNSEILYSRGDWFEKLKGETKQPKGDFWKNMKDSARFLIEHYLMELGVSVLDGNDLFYRNTLNKFIEHACGLLFAINRKFLPDDRYIYGELKRLEKLPDEFFSRFDRLIKTDAEYSAEKKREIATLIAKSILAMN